MITCFIYIPYANIEQDYFPFLVKVRHTFSIVLTLLIKRFENVK